MKTDGLPVVLEVQHWVRYIAGIDILSGNFVTLE
jgi:hypothetical protein